MAMITTRYLGSSLIRNTLRLSKCVAHRSISSKCTPLMLVRSQQVTPIQLNTRYYSSTADGEPEYVSCDLNINEVFDGVLCKKLDLIDVREPKELKETGKIGTSINIPVDEIAKAFTLSPKEFKEKYSVDKPGFSADNVVVYCKTGKRALKVCKELDGMGYHQVKRYPGGIKEWVGILLDEDVK